VNFIPNVLLLPLSEIQIFPSVFSFLWSHNSSVSIVIPYSLDVGGIEVVFLAGTRAFSFLHSVETGTGAHPSFYTMGNEACFPGVKRSGALN
jgi:hypothetical protein